jgi:hypothetical protein
MAFYQIRVAYLIVWFVYSMMEAVVALPIK